MSQNDQEDKGSDWQGLLQVFRSIKDPTLQDELFELFFTMHERKMLEDRYRIVKALLMSGLTQREIAEQLRVSITKMTDGSKALQITSEQLREHLKRQLQNFTAAKNR